ncbi:magnesium transporter CorA family protein [Candidatus Kaiserbacteria bacterium]|nr:magnesium transporter CorA family protein [Candidatus Kaiserbacteria bacterium]
MIETYKQGSLTWVDAREPSNEEIREIIDTYDLSPALLTNLSSPHSHLNSLCVGKTFKVTFHFPVVKRKDMDRPHEVTFIVTKDTLITLRYETMEAIHRFKKEFEVIATLYKTTKRAHGVHLFYALLNECYDSLNAKLDYLHSKHEHIEQEVFTGNEKEAVFNISDVNRRLISFRQTLKVHDSMLSASRRHINECFSEEHAQGLDDIESQYRLLNKRAQTLSESVEALHNTNFALLTAKQNETMKIFTIMAFVTFPLTLFTSLFGMNTQTTPIIGQEGDFWFIVAIMITITIGFFAYFKHKRWI